MKRSLLFFFLFFYGIVQGQKFELYVTNDLIINSCFLMWEDAEKKMMKGIKEGKIPLYTSWKTGETVPKNKLSQQLSLKIESDEGKAFFIPAEWELQVVESSSAKPAFRLFALNEVSRDTQTAGFVTFDQWLSILEPGQRNFLKLMNGLNSPFKPIQILDPSSLYSAFRKLSISLQDSFSNKFFHDVSIKRYDKNLNEIAGWMLDSLMVAISYIKNEPTSEGKSIFQKIDSSQINKGIVIEGNFKKSEIQIFIIGFLHHPKDYPGYDPGIIPLFYTWADDFQKKEKEVYSVLDKIFHYAILYQINPEEYTCKFYKNTQIKIDNRRYPYR